VLDVPVIAAHDGRRPQRALSAVPWAAWVPTSPGASWRPSPDHLWCLDA
jgi:hypothetical protein